MTHLVGDKIDIHIKHSIYGMDSKRFIKQMTALPKKPALVTVERRVSCCIKDFIMFI
jgi:hypothetical protein